MSVQPHMTHKVCHWVCPRVQCVQEPSHFSLKVSVPFTCIIINCITLCVYQICTGPATEAISNRTIVTTVNSSVTLSCEIYGYLPSGSQRQINWQRRNGGSISSSNPPYYTLSTRNGSRQIQNGGISPIPSLVSSLTIYVMDTSVADMYICSGTSNFGTIQLIVNDVGGGMYMHNKSDTGTRLFCLFHDYNNHYCINIYFSVTTTDMALPPSPSGPAGPGDSEANLTPIIGGAVGSVIVLILAIIIVAVAIILLVVRTRRGLSNWNFGGSHDERIYDLPGPADYEQPIAPPVETLPPRMGMNVAYEQAKSFNMNDNSAYTIVARI